MATKKPQTNVSPQSANPAAESLVALVEQVRHPVQSARRAAAIHVNSLQVLTNFEMGRCIVEHEQQGASRAEYGKQVLKALSERLTAEFGRGFSRSNLQNMRTFYLLYQDHLPQIRQKPSGKLSAVNSSELEVSADAPVPFTLSWSHYVFLLGIRDESERRFYEIEATPAYFGMADVIAKVKGQGDNAVPGERYRGKKGG